MARLGRLALVAVLTLAAGSTAAATQEVSCSIDHEALGDAAGCRSEPALVDCLDPSYAWLLEMVGVCETTLAVLPAIPVNQEPDHPRGPSCDGDESCGSSREPVAPGTRPVQLDPAIAQACGPEVRASTSLRFPEVRLRHDRGFPRRLERPPDC